MKIVIFGLGNHFLKYENRLMQEYEIEYIVDNNPTKWGKYKGIPVGSILELKHFEYGFILVTPFEYIDIINQIYRFNEHSKVALLKDINPPCNAWEALDLILSEYNFDTVLDIGCGEGLQSRIMLEHGKTVTSIDKGGSIYFKDNENKSRVLVGDFNELKLHEKYDCIWCSHLLEHQLNVHDFLIKIHDCLIENGILAITVPPIDNVICGGHLTYWNAGILLYNLILAGFDCCSARVGKYGYNISVVLQKKSINVLGELHYDAGDVELLHKYFPASTKFTKTNNDMIFDGNMQNIEWPTPRYKIEIIDDNIDKNCLVTVRKGYV